MTRRLARGLGPAVLAALVLLAASAAVAPTSTAAQARKPGVQKPAAKKPAAVAQSNDDGASETPERAWARARALADDDRHAEALEVLEDARAKHPDDTSLQWLEAGVTGWSGKHDRSVALYEKMVAEHPAMAASVRLDLASQRLWAGDPAGALRDLEGRLQEAPDDEAAERLRALALAHADRHDEALAAYDVLLREHPDDTELMLGRAQALAWDGHHAQATEAYRQVLARSPEAMDARIGVATNENLGGNHRLAAQMFEDILREPEADPEALKGLAYAEYWAGRPDKATAPLERYRALRPQDAEGQELASLLAREFHPGVTAGYDWSSDSDDLHVFTTTLEYRVAADPRNAIALLWRRDHVKDGGGRMEPYRLGIGHERIWSDLWSSRAFLWMFKPGSGRSEHGMGEVALTLRPADRVHFTFGFAKEPVLTRLSLERDIDTRTGAFGVGWLLTPRLTADASHEVIRFSDENRARRTSAGLDFNLTRRRRFEAMLTVGLSHYRVRDDLDNGYYDPQRHFEYGPGVSLKWTPRESASFEIIARVGAQEERGADAEAFHNLRAIAEIPLGKRLSLYTEAETSNSNVSSASGFEQHRWASYLTVPF